MKQNQILLQSNLFIGLMTGTSADGIDCVLVEIPCFDQTKLIAKHFEPFPKQLRDEILSISSNGNTDLQTLGNLDQQLAELMAASVHETLQQAKVKPQHVNAIGLAGQTMWHQPTGKHRFSLQIGDPNKVASLTKIAAISDFRRKDMALGGQGAPLAPIFHQKVLMKDTSNTVIINIGGIANISLLDATGELKGFDTGPGNSLLDTWAALHINNEFDNNGNWAKTGKINPKLLQHLLADPYFKQAAPKSTGKDYFNINWLQNKITNFTQLPPEDIQATLVALTVKTIKNDIIKYFDHGNGFICGGGANNNYLVQSLQQELPNFSIDTTTALGMDPNWVEAICFAWLAYMRVTNQELNICSVTGARQSSCLGAVFSP